jgi:uncharacterized protein YyaL (SSP411 family)
MGLYLKPFCSRKLIPNPQATGHAKFGRVAQDIVEYVTRDLRHPLGGFFSGEDADSLPTPDAEQKHGQFRQGSLAQREGSVQLTSLY